VRFPRLRIEVIHPTPVAYFQEPLPLPPYQVQKVLETFAGGTAFEPGPNHSLDLATARAAQGVQAAANGRLLKRSEQLQKSAGLLRIVGEGIEDVQCARRIALRRGDQFLESLIRALAERRFGELEALANHGSLGSYADSAPQAFVRLCDLFIKDSESIGKRR